MLKREIIEMAVKVRDSANELKRISSTRYIGTMNPRDIHQLAHSIWFESQNVVSRLTGEKLPKWR